MQRGVSLLRWKRNKFSWTKLHDLISKIVCLFVHGQIAKRGSMRRFFASVVLVPCFGRTTYGCFILGSITTLSETSITYLHFTSVPQTSMICFILLEYLVWNHECPLFCFRTVVTHRLSLLQSLFPPW